MSFSSQEKIFSLKFYFFQWSSAEKSSVKLLYKLTVMRFHGLETFWICMHSDCDVVSSCEYNSDLRQ